MTFDIVLFAVTRVLSNMKIIKGNLIDLAEDGEFNIIVQGCNCFNTMGSGIAKEIRERYPAAYEADCQTIKGDRSKLGTYSLMLGKRFNIVNAYTQYDYNNYRDAPTDKFEYSAFSRILQTLAIEYPGCRFGFPEIGCNLAGGDKKVIYTMLIDFSVEVRKNLGTVTLVQFDGSRRR